MGQALAFLHPTRRWTGIISGGPADKEPAILLPFLQLHFSRNPRHNLQVLPDTLRAHITKTTVTPIKISNNLNSYSICKFTGKFKPKLHVLVKSSNQ